MSGHTEPHLERPYSIDPVAIGPRWTLRPKRGDEHAKLIWFVVLSHTPWNAGGRPTWVSNETIMAEAGLRHLRDVERGMARLREAGMLTTSIGERRQARRKAGRVINPALPHPVKVLIPGRGHGKFDPGPITNLWLTCGELRDRPATLVTAVVGLYVLAAHVAGGEHPDGWAPVPCRDATIRRFVGGSEGSTFTRRMRDLETLGLVRTIDGVRHLAPVRLWYQATRAMAKIEPTLYPEIGAVPY